MSKGKWKNHEYKRSKRVTIHLNDEYIRKIDVLIDLHCDEDSEYCNTSYIIRRAIDCYFSIKLNK